MVMGQHKETNHDFITWTKKLQLQQYWPGIADLVSELMVVCPWTHDRWDSVFIFLIYLILYECKSKKDTPWRTAYTLLIFLTVYYAYGHTTLSIAVLVWSLKSSRIGPCQYFDGWLPSNTWWCRFYFLIFYAISFHRQIVIYQDKQTNHDFITWTKSFQIQQY